MVIIHGNGATLTRSGSVAFRILQVATNSTLAIDHLTISNGAVANVFTGNSYGGAIYNNGGALTISSCAFNLNSVKGLKGADGISVEVNGNNGDDAVGGAINCYGGSITATSCSFTNNTVSGGDGGKGYNGAGSGGGNGGNGGLGVAGAINTAVSQPSTISRCTFTGNAVANGAPGLGTGQHTTGTSGVCGGGAIYVGGALPVTVNLCTFTSNSALGSTAIYPGMGGAIAVPALLTAGDASLHVTSCDFSSNRADKGGAVIGASFSGCSFQSNSATMEGGAAAAYVYANLVSTFQSTPLVNCTFYQNAAPYGGAFYCTYAPAGPMINCTFVSNTATTAGGNVSGGTATNCIFKGGSPNNLTVGGASNGHNISDDAAGGDTGTAPGGYLNKTGDLRNTNPQIVTSAPANNGGPTKTFAIGVFGVSPAINAGDDNYAPRRDQRGNFRTGRSDIGAFEYFGGLVGGITIARNGNDAVVSAELVYGLTYRLQRKTSLLDSTWQDISGISDLTATDNDTESITDLGALSSQTRAFYRVTFEN